MWKKPKEVSIYMYRKKMKTDIEKLLIAFEELTKQSTEQKIVIQQMATQITCLESTQEYLKSRIN